MDRKVYKNVILILWILITSHIWAQKEKIYPIVGVEYQNFYSVFNGIGCGLGVSYNNFIDASVLFNYNWYYNSQQSKYYELDLNFNSIGLNLSCRPLKYSFSPRFEMRYEKGASKTNNGTVLGYSGFPTNITDSLSYLGKFKNLNWSFKLGGGLDYSWRNINVYLGMGYQWWEFNINRNFYHAYFTVGHRGLYYNARIAYRFGKKDKQELQASFQAQRYAPVVGL